MSSVSPSKVSTLSVACDGRSRYRGEMHDDPIVDALRDPASYVLVTAMVGLTYLAS